MAFRHVRLGPECFSETEAGGLASFEHREEPVTTARHSAGRNELMHPLNGVSGLEPTALRLSSISGLSDQALFTLLHFLPACMGI